MQIRNTIYLFGIALLIIGLPFSRALISISELILIINWLFTKDIIKNFRNFFRNRQSLIFAGIYLMHLIGLLYTSDMSHGFQEFKTKIPILILPLIFVTSRSVSKQQMRFFLLLFAAAVTASIGTSLFLYYSQDIIHFREAFPFISHIRLSLMIVISITILYYYLIFEPIPIRGLQVVMILIILFLISALLLLELLSGLVILVLVVLTTLFYHSLFKRKRLLTFLVASAFFMGGISFVIWDSYNSYFPDEEPDLSELPVYTQNQNPYRHIFHPYDFENNSYIMLYVCEEELEKEWNKRSSMEYRGNDKMGQLQNITLIRYLNSKQLTKDSAGLAQLTNEDIHFVENGIANHEYTKKRSIRKRLYKIFWEYNLYRQQNDVAGHSAIQRLELWKVAGEIINDNWLLGIGTGDIKAEFKDRLEEKDGNLKQLNLRTHNQFLSIMIAFGVLGFLYFLFALTYSAYMLKGFNHYLFLSFFVIISASMLWEDTLETQVGATLFAFFYAFYLFAPSSKNRSLRR